jgi:hypothetical protein
MTPRNFVYLAIAAALSVLFAVVSFASNNQWSTGKSAGADLFPTLVSDASQISTIEVRQGDNSVVLERTGGSWGLKSRGGYPADPSKVRALLVGLAEADLVESKTRRPDRYAALELEDPADKSAKSRIVRLLGAKGNVMGEVVIGKKRLDLLGTGKSGTYVRKPSDPQTWLANAELDASATARDWLKTSVFTTDAARISRITIEITGEQPLRIERQAPPPKDAKDTKQSVPPDAAAAKLQFASFPPADKKLKDAGAAEGIARALASIDMDDVRKLDAPPSGAGVSIVKIESADGPTSMLRLRKDGDAHWLSLATTGDGEAKQAADEINQRTQGWEFKIPAAKVDSILKKRADLLEAPPPAAEPKK